MSHFRSFSHLYSIVLNVTAIMGFAWQSSLHKLSWTDRHCSCHDELRAHEKKCDNLSNKPQHLHYGSLDERGIRLTVIMWSHLSPHLVSQQFVYCSHHMVRAKPVKKKTVMPRLFHITEAGCELCFAYTTSNMCMKKSCRWQQGVSSAAVSFNKRVCK